MLIGIIHTMKTVRCVVMTCCLLSTCAGNVWHLNTSGTYQSVTWSSTKLQTSKVIDSWWLTDSFYAMMLYQHNFIQKNVNYPRKIQCEACVVYLKYKEGRVDGFVCSLSLHSHATMCLSFNQLQQCLSLTRKGSPDGTSPDWVCEHLIAAYSSFIYPKRMKGWVGLVG